MPALQATKIIRVKSLTFRLVEINLYILKLLYTSKIISFIYTQIMNTSDCISCKLIRDILLFKFLIYMRVHESLTRWKQKL